MRERNAKIVKLFSEEKLSYGQLALRFGMSRSAVAGVIYRSREAGRQQKQQKRKELFGKTQILGKHHERT